MFDPRQKRLLALDGGGILGIISLYILKEIEDKLREVSGADDAFRLRDFFDYIAGTSTGAIIAAGLALGFSVQELLDFYVQEGSRMFRRSWLWALHHKFSTEPLAKALKEKLSEDTIQTLQAKGRLSTSKHLLIVTQNISSDSPWPVSTNPRAKYNNTSRRDCNLGIPLWQLVRASTAAPYYFAPQQIYFVPQDPSSCRMFEDGGVTPYNNPSFLLYRMATLPEYECKWSDGEQNMMLVSVGTGNLFRAEPRIRRIGRLALKNATSMPGSLMHRISIENDILCRTVGRCVFGAKIDREIGALVTPLSKDPRDLHKRFLCARYNPDISRAGLAALGLQYLNRTEYDMDDVTIIPYLQTIGSSYAKKFDFASDFSTFIQCAGALGAANNV